MLNSIFRRELSDYWIRFIFFDIDFSNLFYKYIFILSTENQFLLYEYRRDKLCKRVLKIDNVFFQTPFSYLRAHKLTEILTLEILKYTTNALLYIWKFVLGKQRTVQVHKNNRVAQTSTYRIIGWSFAQNKNNTISVKRYETHASIGNCKYRVFTDRKIIRKIDNVLNLFLHEKRFNNSSINKLSNKSFVLNDVVWSFV